MHLQAIWFVQNVGQPFSCWKGAHHGSFATITFYVSEGKEKPIFSLSAALSSAYNQEDKLPVFDFFHEGLGGALALDVNK